MTDPVCGSSHVQRYQSPAEDDDALCSRQPKEPARAPLLDAWHRQQESFDGRAEPARPFSTPNRTPWCEMESEPSPAPPVGGEPAVWEKETPETSVSWECWNDCVSSQAGTMLPSGAIVGVAAAVNPLLGAGLAGLSAGLYGGACYEACADLESAGVRAPEALGEHQPPIVHTSEGPDASWDPADASGYATP